jgi:hypothetical protein
MAARIGSAVVITTPMMISQVSRLKPFTPALSVRSR